MMMKKGYSHTATWVIYGGLILIILIIIASVYGSLQQTRQTPHAAGIPTVTPTLIPLTPTCTIEICDGKDNDCDGSIDEGNVCLTPPIKTTTYPTSNPTQIPTIIPSGSPSLSLLKNSGFEVDANNDTRPDSWTTDSRVTISSVQKASGSYSARFASLSDETATIKSDKISLSSAYKYVFTLWMNIPTNPDSFSLNASIEFFDTNNTLISSMPLITRTTDTSGLWSGQGKSGIAPPSGTAKARIVIQVKSLKNTLYIDTADLRIY